MNCESDARRVMEVLLGYFRDERGWEVSGCDDRSTQRVAPALTRERELARGVTAVVEDAPAEPELAEAPDKVPATVGG